MEYSGNGVLEGLQEPTCLVSPYGRRQEIIAMSSGCFALNLTLPVWGRRRDEALGIAATLAGIWGRRTHDGEAADEEWFIIDFDGEGIITGALEP